VLCFWLCTPFEDCLSVNEEEGTVVQKKKKKKNLKANFLSNTQHGTTLNAHSRLYIKMMHDDDHFESSKNLVCNQLAKDVSLPQKLYPTSK
jgi:hypothetical protein